MVDRVISDGAEGDAFEPRLTTHGFQYVRVQGHPGRLTPDEVTGVVVHTNLRRTGWFRCSDERINRLHEIVEWSFRDNACEVPTDCPHRQRSGWTGDWQLFAPTAAFLYDVAGFSLKWLRDLAAECRPDGCVLNYAPDPNRALLSDTSNYRSYINGSSGWGDAIVMVPWEMWRAYRDRDVLAELWPAMVRWVDFAAEAARSTRYSGRAAARPEAAPYEKFLWDGGFHWGEWNEPDADEHPFFEIDQGHVGTAFLHHSSALAARIGRMLGHDDEAARFDELSRRALNAWRTEYIAADGSLTPDTQANHVRALAFGLVPEELRDQTAARLVELIRGVDTHLGTGFLATPYLLPVLADTGHLDVAYDLLFQDTPPSWLAMVERGATTVWEDWDGIGDDGTPKASLNHYSKGAVISFLHRYVAGIQLLDDHPGYRRFRIAPQPGGDLTWSEAVHDSPYGRIESSWRLDGRRFRLTATVPPGTTAEIVLPDGSTTEQGPGTATHALA
jgi:alpha-L-rhamnosidase